MTPCEKLGYKVGDKFTILESNTGFTEGQTVELFRDDGTACPLFKGDNHLFNVAGGEQGAYCALEFVQRKEETTNPLKDYREMVKHCEAIMHRHIQKAMEEIQSEYGTTPTSVDVYIVSKRTFGEEWDSGILAGVEVEFDS